MTIASSSSGRLMQQDDSSFMSLKSTSGAAAEAPATSATRTATATTTTAPSLPCSDHHHQPLSDDSSASTTVDIFQNMNDDNNNNNNNKVKQGEVDEGDEDYSLQDAQTRISHALPQATEAAHALFGTNVGPCWGDYACTHHRIPGRFYATTCAILFHTNLLGFERRVCLLFQEVVEIQLFRSTSIKIQTLDMETYIFKSFSDRERVLHLLNGLKILADNHTMMQKETDETGLSHSYRNRNSNNRVNKNNNMSLLSSQSASDEERHRQLSRLNESEESRKNNYNSSSTTSKTATVLSTKRAYSFSSLTGPFNIPFSSASSHSSLNPPPAPPCPLFTANRRRTVSDSTLRLVASRRRVESINNATEGEEHPIPLTEPQSFINFNGGIGGGSVGGDFDSSFLQDDDLDINNNHVKTNNINDTNDQPLYDDDTDHNLLQHQQQQDLESSWEKAKQTHPTPTGEPLQEVGIDSITLSPCSLQDFFQHFLSNKAKYSLDWYQREYIKDYNVQISSWELVPATAGGDALDSQQQPQQQDDVNNAVTTAFQRTMTFTHPINNNDINNHNRASLSSWSSSLTSMMGPTAAQTTRHQHLQCFGRFGMVITNKTLVQGIPACDTFHVQDKWIVEVVRRPSTPVAQPPQLRISVRFEPHFTKLSLLKPIVQKSVRKETKDWMDGYVDMLQGAIKELAAAAAVNNNNNSSSALSSKAPTKPKTALMEPTARPHREGGGYDDSEAEASAMLPMIAAASRAVAKPSTTAAVSAANDMAQQQQEQQQQQPRGDVLVFAKSVQRLVALAIVLVILLGVLLLFQLVALQATLSTLQLQVQGVHVQNAMVMYQLQRQLLALQLQQMPE